MKKTLKSSIVAVALCAVMHHRSALAQGLVLNTNQNQTSYSQNFDNIGTSFPSEWLCYKAATSSSLGTVVSFTSTPTGWSSSSFLFANYCSVSNYTGTAFNGTESTTIQSACSNRSLAVRTTAASGDPGAAFVLEINNTTNLVNFKLDFDIAVLSVQGRTNIWTVDYGFGSTPTSFTVADASKNFTAVGTFGAAHRTISFGGALDNNVGPVWIRIVTLAATTGTSSRPTVGIDNVVLTYTNAPTVASPIVITSQPHSVTNNAGTSASFTVAVTGTSPAYQWYQIDAAGNTNQLSDGTALSGDGSSYSGTQSSTLTINNVYGAESNLYFVNITNTAPTGNNTNSAAVKLAVNDPIISAQPVNMTNVLNDVDLFSATVVCSQPSQQLWYYNGAVISNVDAILPTNSSTIFVINDTTATNLTGYYLVASNQYGMVTSAVATASIAVTPPVEIVRWDFNQTTQYTTTNPSPSLGTGTAYPVQNPAVSNFVYAAGALFDPAQLGASATNQAWALNGFVAGISNKTAGFQFNVSTVGYTNIMLTWSERHSATASKYMRVQYTTNGTDYVDGDVVTFSQVAYQFYSSDLSAKPGVANNPNFGFRVVAEWESTAIGDATASYAGTSSTFGSGGTIRVDLMTVFGKSLGNVASIPLYIGYNGTNAILTWTDPAGAFSLQSAPLATGTYTNIVGATSPYTNLAVGSQQYFRLKSN